MILFLVLNLETGTLSNIYCYIRVLGITMDVDYCINSDVVDVLLKSQLINHFLCVSKSLFIIRV